MATTHGAAADQISAQPIAEDDNLLLGMNALEFRTVLDDIPPTHNLCTAGGLLDNDTVPTNQAEADALVAKIEQAYREENGKEELTAADRRDMGFKIPAYRILTKQSEVLWEAAPGTPIGEVIRVNLNGYDGLEVRGGGGWRHRGLLEI